MPDRRRFVPFEMTTLLHASRPPARRTYLLLLLSLAAAAACTDDDGVTPGNGDPVPIALEVVQSGFTNPLYVTAPPGDADRLFVVERGGLVRIFE